MAIGYVEAMGLGEYAPKQRLEQGGIYPAEYAGRTDKELEVILRGEDDQEYPAIVVPSRAKKNIRKGREDTARFVLGELGDQFGKFSVRLISSPEYMRLKVVIYA
jgi:hypothetical protein|tara:strand:- start:108 stop:422 length:315 start_codon:yes stop_codon:yes gene_type:complete